MFSLIRRRSILSRLPTVWLIFEHHGLDYLLTAEHQELAGKRSCAATRLLDLLEAAAIGLREITALEQQIAVSVDHGEQVVEVVRHSAGEQTNRFHFLGLLQELFRSREGFLGRCLFSLRAIQYEGQDPHQGHEQHHLADHQTRDVQDVRRSKTTRYGCTPLPEQRGQTLQPAASFRANQPPG